FKENSIELYRKYFPSPHSELLIGMVMGADELGKIPKFKESLKSTGTIHVVVVSGFNISLVFSLVIGLLGSKYKTKNLIIAQFITLLYSMMTGFEPPVIRAWVMGSLVSWAKYYGRGMDGFRVLIFTALFMILIWPYFLLSVSFQLSFLATFGLVIYGNFFQRIFKNIFKVESFLVEDLSTTVSAQVFVLPIVSLYFGRISLVSFIVNPLVLWTVPISTILGSVFLLLGSISQVLGRLFALFMYPFLDIFTSLIWFFGGFTFSSMSFSADIKTVVVYYLFTLLGGYFINRNKGKIYENK
ncbi:MAG: ComEC/Rec2 family competence protein, partial [Patescibacteria group bacterium]